MNLGKLLIGAGVAVGMMSSTVAMAATRSGQALPSVKGSATLPVQGLRNATPMKRKSAQAEDSSTWIVAGLAAAAVVGGIIVVASDNNNNTPSSPG